MSPRALTPAQAQRVYDRIGRHQDSQAFYEDPAVLEGLSVAKLGAAASVLEIGCGTGRWAARMLERHLPADAGYLGLDLSPTMLSLARRRLGGLGGRAAIARADVTRGLPVADGSVDRVIVTYVFDLLARDVVTALLTEVRRALVPGGILCSVGLTRGRTPVARVVSTVWSGLFRLSPSVVGGCRPLELRPLLSPGQWRLLHHHVVTSWGVPSEVAVVEAR